MTHSLCILSISSFTDTLIFRHYEKMQLKRRRSINQESASQFPLVYKPKVHFHVHKGSPVDLILSQLSPITPFLHLHVFSHLHVKVSNGLSLEVSRQNYGMCITYILHVLPIASLWS